MGKRSWLFLSESGDADVTGKPRLLVFDNVTVECPVPQIIGDQSDIECFFPQQESCICPIVGDCPFIGADGQKSQAVQMDGMFVGAFIA